MNDIFPSNFNALVNSFFNEDVEENRGFNAFRPSADIKETNDSFELKVEKDILGNKIKGAPDLGAIEIN